jgi:hypothetical protein
MGKLKLTESELIELINKIINEQSSDKLFDVLKQKYNFVSSDNGVKFRGVKKVKYYDRESKSEEGGNYVVEIELYDESLISFILFVPPGYDSYQALADEVNIVMDELGSEMKESQDGIYRDGEYNFMKYSGGDLNNQKFFELISKLQNSVK